MTLEELKSRLDACSNPLLVGPLAKDLPLSQHDLTIFIDGGSQLSSRLQGQPTVSIGDGDSGESSRLDYKLPQEKDYSDLAFVLNHLPRKIKTMKLVGFIGGRIDHQLAVFGEVYYFLKVIEAEKVEFDDHVLTFLDRGTHKLNFFGRFSLMAFDPCEVLLTGNAKYTVQPKSVLQPLSSFGLSNIANGQFSIETSEPLLLIQGRATEDI